jgi:alkylated DNA repair protein (DNA oxidative demethylase)
MPSSSKMPSGFSLHADLLTEEDERRALAFFEGLPFASVMMRGRELRRQIASFGIAFGTNFQSLKQAPTMPPVLRRLRTRAARVAGVYPPMFRQALVQRYPPAAAIGWHRDSDAFGETILGISFGSVAHLRFRHERLGKLAEVVLPQRSIYVLTGASRDEWQHSIAPLAALRYSITFRSLVSADAGPRGRAQAVRPEVSRPAGRPARR